MRLRHIKGLATPDYSASLSFILHLFNLSMGGTKLLQLLVGPGNPWSCTIAGVRLKYFKIDNTQYNSANEFYHVRLSLTV